MHVLLLENGYMCEVCIQWLNCIVLCAVKCVLNTTLDYKQPIRLDRITHAKHLNLKYRHIRTAQLHVYTLAFLFTCMLL